MHFRLSEITLGLSVNICKTSNFLRPQMASKLDSLQITHHIPYIQIIPHPKTIFQSSITQTKHSIKVKFSLPLQVKDLTLKTRVKSRISLVNKIQKI